MLTISDHSRDSAGLRYVYPVVSRRAGGVSVGINLNVNNACNWACVYCQVENLTRGGPPPVDLNLLEHELDAFLGDALHGDFMQRDVPEGARQLVDVAFSGNGEPTSADEFPESVALVARVLERRGLKGVLPVRLITNGSLLYRPRVQQAIAALGSMPGEVWFKVDRGDAGGLVAVNETALDPARVARHLAKCVELAPTWVQTCWFAMDGVAPTTETVDAYCALVKPVAGKLAGIHLYGLARPSMQPAGARLTRLSGEEMQQYADEIQKRTGIRVMVSP